MISTAASYETGKINLSVSQKLGLKFFLDYLGQWKIGSLRLILPDGREIIKPQNNRGYQGVMRVKDNRFFNSLLWNGDVGFGTSYCEGYWESPDLLETLKLFVQNFEYAKDHGYGLSWVGEVVQKLYHKFRKNTLSGSKQNIQQHYDLGNELYTRFLDSTMMYSCALFESRNQPLEEAQKGKVLRLMEKANVSEGDHVLEIGSGWGYMALSLAKLKKCKVTSLTLSKEQFAYVNNRIREEGLEEMVEIKLMDYRNIEGQFDAIVSVEMIEAVGHEYLQGFFEKCYSILKPGGRFALQSITINDEQYEEYRKSCDFIQRYIFPGSCVPSRKVLKENACEKVGFKQLEDFEMGKHYAQTLGLWKQSFTANWEKIKPHGYDSYFFNLWIYYMVYCQAGFDTGYLGTSQLCYEK